MFQRVMFAKDCKIMFLDYVYQNNDILAVINAQKNNFGFHSNRKTQGHKHQLNNLYFKYQVCQMKLRHLNTFLQFRLLFHEPHYTWSHLDIQRFLSQRRLLIYCLRSMQRVSAVFAVSSRITSTIVSPSDFIIGR